MTTKFDERMEEFFNVEPTQEEFIPKETKILTFHENLEQDFIDDYRTARSNIDELIEKGKDALDVIIEIAKSNEKGRDFEVAATLLSDIVAANEKLVSLHKTVREIANYKNSTEQPKTTVNNTLFVGSTAELSRMIKEMKEKEVIEAEID